MDGKSLTDPALARPTDLGYRSYPTVLQYREDFDAAAYRRAALLSNSQLKPLALHIHAPGDGPHRTDQPRRYAMALQREIDLQAPLFRAHRRVAQVHCDAAAASLLGLSQLETVLRHLRARFTLIDCQSHEYSIEIDTRTFPIGTMPRLARLAFNNVCLLDAPGGASQELERAAHLVEAARGAGIASITACLNFPLPDRDADDLVAALQALLEARPDRLMLQPGLGNAALGVPGDVRDADAQCLQALQLVAAKLGAAGYVHAGMGCFALPTDMLAAGWLNRSLGHGLQGLAHADCDTIGIGAGAISKVGRAYGQNLLTVSGYCSAIEDHQLAVRRGLLMSADDRIRHDVIQQLLGQGTVSLRRIERAHCIDFKQYFAPELARLQLPSAQGLASASDEAIVLSETGRLCAQRVAALFDAYAHQPGSPATAG